MKKIFPLILLVVGIIGMIFNINSNNQTIVLNEKYINSEVLSMSMDSIDKILFTDSKNNFTSCVCSVNDENLMLLLLENNNYYDLNYKYSFSIDSLTEKPDDVLSDKVLNSDAKIAYNIFLNPKIDTILINNVECEIKKINYSTEKGSFVIGFWWYEIED